MSNIDKSFNEALAALNNRDLRRAEELFRHVIRSDESNVPALNLLVVVLMSMERFSEAEPFIKKATSRNQKSDVSFYNYGLISKRLNKPRQAVEHFSKVLGLNSNVAETWNNRGTVFNDLKEYNLAIADFDKAIALNSVYGEAYANKGKSLTLLKRYDEAFSAYDKALSIKPDLENAWLGRGNALWTLKRYGEAFSAYDKALSIKPDLADAWLGRGNIFTDLKRYDEAFAAYDKALSIKPDLADAWLGRGNIFTDLKRYDEAFAAYDKALSIKPDLENSWLGRGNVFWNLKRYDDAFSAYDKALSIRPDLAEAWLGRGNVLYDLKRHDEAFSSYDKALSIKPDLEGVEGARLHTKMHLCNWDKLEEEIIHLTTSIQSGKASSPPFTLLSLTDSSVNHFRCAQAWVAAKYPKASKSIWQGTIYAHDRIRLGYVSADFHQHATSILMAELFELHDKTRFEISAYSIGPDDESGIRKRLMHSFDSFLDCRDQSDAEVARSIARAEIDILVDLKGFTQDARTNIFACRPAPIQVNYLGYPGTMAASYIDYIIGDKTILATSDPAAYSEQLVILPHTYQPNDRKRLVANKSFRRQDFELPVDQFVFCCFNNSYKILPEMFDCWMRILKGVEGSALWLLAENQTAMENLKKQAGIRGVDPARLVFAQRMELPEHLARHRLADLFLDTLPCNAHTTASDALWAGLPVLTQSGETFAGRVAASLLSAVGVPELITQTSEQYESLAIELAKNPNKLAAIKDTLEKNRLTTPLFDSKLFTKHIEAAYQAMYDRYQAGLPPHHIIVPI